MAHVAIFIRQRAGQLGDVINVPYVNINGQLQYMAVNQPAPQQPIPLGGQPQMTPEEREEYELAYWKSLMDPTPKWLLPVGIAIVAVLVLR